MTDKIKKQKKVFEITYKRDGLDSYMTCKASSELENLFKSGGEDDQDTSKQPPLFDKQGNQIVFYKRTNNVLGLESLLTNRNLNIGYGRRATLVNQTYLINNDYVNLSILRVKGLTDGVTFKIEGILLDSQLTEWSESVGKVVRFIYQNVMKQTEVKINITTEL